MKTLRTYLWSVATLLFVACGNDMNTGAEGNPSVETEAKVVMVNTSCYERFDYDYSAMLTMDDVLKHIPVSDPEAIELKFKANNGISQRYNECVYQWASDRPDLTMSVSGFSIHGPDRNTVSLNNLNFFNGNAKEALESFERVYKKITEEEYVSMAANIDNEFKDKTEDERNTMKGFLETRKNLNFEELPGLGTAAYWHSVNVSGVYYGVKIYVLIGTVEFEISAKVSLDDQENVNAGRLLAQEVLNKCV